MALAIDVIVNMRSGWWIKNVEGCLNVISMTVWESWRVGEMMLIISPVCQHSAKSSDEGHTFPDMRVDPAFLQVDHPSYPLLSHDKSLSRQSRATTFHRDNLPCQQSCLTQHH